MILLFSVAVSLITMYVYKSADKYSLIASILKHRIYSVQATLFVLGLALAYLNNPMFYKPNS